MNNLVAKHAYKYNKCMRHENKKRKKPKHKKASYDNW